MDNRHAKVRRCDLEAGGYVDDAAARHRAARLRLGPWTNLMDRPGTACPQVLPTACPPFAAHTHRPEFLDFFFFGNGNGGYWRLEIVEGRAYR